MEHLPLPRGAELSENDIVPYISSTDYVGVPFLSYPRNKGYEHAIPQHDRPSLSTHEGVYPTPNDQLASFLQTWLFFGMIQEALGSLYRHEDFVRSCESKEGPIQVLITAKLPLLLTEKFSSVPAADDEHTSLTAQIRECIVVAGNATTNEEADHVLVLESSLRCCDTKSSDLIEIAVSIFTSPWLRRLWCLQKEALAKRLWFQFQDRPVDLAEVFEEFRAVYQSRNISQMELVFNMSAILRSLRLFEKDPHVTAMTLQKVVRAFQYRGVSVASDEPDLPCQFVRH